MPAVSCGVKLNTCHGLARVHGGHPHGHADVAVPDLRAGMGLAEVATMSISGREQQALDSIGHRLAGSDPELASLLGVFGRVTSSEEMPAHEEIRAPWRARRLRRNRARKHARRLPLGLGSARIALLLWLVAAVVLIAVAVIADRTGGRGACTRARGASCAWSAPAREPTTSSRVGARSATGPGITGRGASVRVRRGRVPGRVPTIRASRG